MCVCVYINLSDFQLRTFTYLKKSRDGQQLFWAFRFQSCKEPCPPFEKSAISLAATETGGNGKDRGYFNNDEGARRQGECVSILVDSIIEPVREQIFKGSCNFYGTIMQGAHM